MFGGISDRTFDIGDALSACRSLKPARWGLAGLCLLLGLSVASLIDRYNSDEVAPAQVVALSGGGSSVVAPAEAVAQIRRSVLAPAALVQMSADLKLAESGLFRDRKAEDFLAENIAISPSSLGSIIDIQVKTGEPAFDALIANQIARNLTAPAPAKATAVDAPVRFSLVSRAHVIPAASVLIYQAEALILSLLLAAAVIALGVARELRTRIEPLDVPQRPATVVPRGILEQIDMLERMWPDTGRQNAMPEGSNDEPEQIELKPARDIVTRMTELRLDARTVILQPSEQGFEDVLTDMQSLRDQVRWITAEQLRRRRKVNAFGR